jgi:ribonucleoside-diphosphate reductase alpha chain
VLTKIIKRDGKTIENYDPSKLVKWGIWAAKKLGNRVDWSGVIMDAQALVPSKDGVAYSQDLQDTLISLLLARKDWPHNLMAGRLQVAKLRKELYDEYIPTVAALHNKLFKLGLMKELNYSEDDYRQVETIIKHERDFDLAHFQVEYSAIKYGLKNLKTKEQYESPQFIFIRLAMHLAEEETGAKRMEIVKDLYDELSEYRLNPPTPALNNLGTNDTGLASCCLYKTGDTIPSIEAGDSIAYLMTAASAGIGGIISTRSVNDPVRSGKIQHQGKTHYLRAVAGAVKANKQGSRGGAITSFVPVFDPEIEAITVLQGVRTPTDKQNRDVHIALQSNQFLTQLALDRKKMFLFNPFTAPDLYEAFFAKDQDLFPFLYRKYENDEGFKKVYVDAYAIMRKGLVESLEVGTLYEAMMDEINRHTPHLDPIHSSNLCVSYDTPILTKEHGYVAIGDYIDKEVHVWNGQNWSKTTVRKTGENQKLLTVVTKQGSVLDATEYHKWYVQTQNIFGGLGKVVEKRTHELLPGDKLIKFDLSTVDHGNETLPLAYENGFFTGDGTHISDRAISRIYLYNDKRYLLDHFNTSGSICKIYPYKNRISLDYKEETLLPKFSIPSNSYSRLNWLEGLLDSDGCITDNKGCKSLQLASVNFDFLTKLRLMLQELGVNSSISKAAAAGYRPMPDGKGGTTQYYCNETWRILVSNSELVKLKLLGLKTKRLDLTDVREGNRDAKQFDSIVTVLDNGINSDTYCFTEPEKNMGMFMGVLTGNCLEITQPTWQYESSKDLYAESDPGYIEVEVEYPHTGMSETRQFEYSEPIQFNNELFRDRPVLRKAGAMKIGDSYMHLDNQDFTVKAIKKVKISPEVSLCSLAAVVAHNVHTDEQYAKTAYYALYVIDRCIDIATYPLPHIKYTSMQRRNAGVGISGVATVMARLNLKYDTLEGRNQAHIMAERHSYFLIKAALQHGKEKGNAPWMHKTLWPQGWLPIDTYKKTVDELVSVGLQYDWETLREEIIENGGIRFSSLVAHMPLESSSKSSGGPNSLYAIRDLTVSKTDGSSKIDWAATDSDLLKDNYQIAWTIDSVDMFKYYAVWQKFGDQAISADLHKDRRGKKLMYSERKLIEERCAMVRYGNKTRYYQNILTDESEGRSTETEKDDCAGGACKM